MSWGLFQVNNNNGKFEKNVNSINFLSDRIKDILKKKNNICLKDITETHEIYVYRKFKPSVKIAFEYHKIKTQNPVEFGGRARFSIPQFGDFYHDSVICARIGKVNALPIDNILTPEEYLSNNNIEISNNFYRYQNIFGGGLLNRNLVRFCEYPGERIFHSTRLETEGSIIDEYKDFSMPLLRTRIPENKLTSYKKMIGQEIDNHNSNLIVLQIPKLWKMAILLVQLGNSIK